MKIMKFVQCSKCFILHFKDAYSKCTHCKTTINRIRPDKYYNSQNEVDFQKAKYLPDLKRDKINV